MESFVRYFEESGNQLICAIANESSLKDLSEYLIFEKKQVPAVNFFESGEVYSITPLGDGDSPPLLIHSSFSDIITLKLIISLKKQFTLTRLTKKKKAIIIFLPISDDPEMNVSILDKTVNLAEEEQISEIINLEYIESGKLIENRRNASDYNRKIHDLFIKSQQTSADKRDLYLAQFAEFKNMKTASFWLQFEYLKIVYGQPTAGIFAAISTIPSIWIHPTTFSGIPKGYTIDRFLDKHF